jgi:hypothetical protein
MLSIFASESKIFTKRIVSGDTIPKFKSHVTFHTLLNNAIKQPLISFLHFISNTSFRPGADLSKNILIISVSCHTISSKFIIEKTQDRSCRAADYSEFRDHLNGSDYSSVLSSRAESENRFEGVLQIFHQEIHRSFHFHKDFAHSCREFHIWVRREELHHL